MILSEVIKKKKNVYLLSQKMMKGNFKGYKIKDIKYKVLT